MKKITLALLATLFLASCEKPEFSNETNQLSAYPSPAINLFNVDFNNPSGQAHITVINPKGETLLDETVGASVDTYRYNFDIRKQPSGQYHVFLKEESGTFEKIIVKP